MIETRLAGTGGDFPPRGSCDCHVHVIGPKSRYPLAPVRSYIPADAPVTALQEMMARVDINRAVIVQPSVYGTDNRCLLDALAVLQGAGRGVAVVADDVSAGELDAMHAPGVRGLRLNTVSTGQPSSDALREELKRTADRCARHGWHVQIFAAPALIETLAPALSQLPVPVVFDHFGLVRPERIDSEAFRIIAMLMAEGKAWTKLSGFYRVAEDAFDPAIGDLCRQFVDANPEQVVWASDWPHTPPHQGHADADDHEVPYRDMDTKGLLWRLQDWFDEPRRLRQILVENPARLYGFDERLSVR